MGSVPLQLHWELGQQHGFYREQPRLWSVSRTSQAIYIVWSPTKLIPIFQEGLKPKTSHTFSWNIWEPVLLHDLFFLTNPLSSFLDNRWRRRKNEEGEQQTLSRRVIWFPETKFISTYCWKELHPLWNRKLFILYYYWMDFIRLWRIINREMGCGERSEVSDLWELASEFIQINGKHLCRRSPQASK